MIFDFKLDPDTHDVVFEKGDLVQETDPAAALAQTVVVGLKMWLGESLIDTSQGMPWFEEILGRKEKDMSLVVARVENFVSQIPGVTSVTIEDADFNYTTRALSFGLFINTEDGETIEISPMVIVRES